MNSSTTQKIDIQKVSTSRIGDVDFDNLTFGSTFSDHMFECDYKDGEWQNPTIKPYGPLTISPAAKVFHYGQAVFEGMKAFKDEDGKVWLFRPEENFNRINRSSKRMAIPEFPKDIFFEALTTLVKMDKEWVKPGLGNSLYIRPFVMATQVGVSASPSTEYKFMILMSPAQAYYTGDVKVVIAEHYSRSANGGVGAAKAAGNYGAQFFPTNLAREKGFQQVIWTDASDHKYLEEAGTMNVFFRVNDTLLTAPISDRILDGVTRKSVIAIAKRDNITVEERPVLVSEIVEAAKNGSLKEIFGAGTAAVISPVSAFSYKETVYELEKQEHGFATRFKNELMNIQYNRSEDPFGWRFEVV
ncbi:MAG TPA: branched-chain amino acid aminotransferase [Aequorivita sp.]|jgi:branched-chain amino acid aminotransferase|nr:branched chain amino acid aminotransferase [Aequorivita sp.]MBP42023.1 branched chain amino acid aminotransferase [Aequorivita sp.]HBC04642.1 branched chain amino acid aminotransferase [Aequorivita sp.]HNP68381.1 branched-chain amino acid aminotransferase [Aequorivita sp.]|tara:strand:+ start:13285 stop:14355 length:1071 start_codon:yes stop_codon:yes gene_type:complete